MKKIIVKSVVLFAALSAAILMSCDPAQQPGPDAVTSPGADTGLDSGTEVAVTGISLNQSASYLFTGETLQLTGVITPDDATNKNISWSSSNTSVAAVSADGLVTAAGVGTAGITAKTEDGAKTTDRDINIHQKKNAHDAVLEDYFGESTAIDGDIALVAAPSDDVGGSRTGSVYVFSRNEGGDNTWGFMKKINASDAAEGDQFGHHVAIDGDYAIISSMYDADNGLNSGSAYIFNRNRGGADNWGQVAKLTAVDGAAQDLFGCVVSISGDYAIVGSRRDDDGGTNSGSAYIFHKDEGGPDNWGQLKKIRAADAEANAEFGIGVSISGNYAVAGAFRNNTFGAAYVYYRNSGAVENSWNQVAKITAADAAAGDRFGISVSLSGDDLIVGADADDDNGNSSGSVYFFNRNQGGADNWGQVVKQTAQNGAENDMLGWPVYISGDYAVAGVYSVDSNGKTDSGAAYVYQRDAGGADNWGQVCMYTAIDPAVEDYFGYSAGISGGTVIIGVKEDDDTEQGTGSAYLFSVF